MSVLFIERGHLELSVLLISVCRCNYIEGVQQQCKGFPVPNGVVNNHGRGEGNQGGTNFLNVYSRARKQYYCTITNGDPQKHFHAFEETLKIVHAFKVGSGIFYHHGTFQPTPPLAIIVGNSLIHIFEMITKITYHKVYFYYISATLRKRDLKSCPYFEM